MNSPIYFLLISCLSIIIGGTSPFPDLSELEKIAGENQSIIPGSFLSNNRINLKLSKGGEIFRNKYALVWKGTYNQTIDVAIKIVSKGMEKAMRTEVKIFEALEATKNDDIEKHRIPRVYYHGPIFAEYFAKYFAIAMTLFEETLENRLDQYVCENKKFSESTILLIFKQAAEALKYIHSKNVTHNDIKLRNIFIHGKSVFIGDFDSSKLDGDRMEDYAALLLVIWDLLGVPQYDAYGPSAEILKHFQNAIVQEAFHSILNTKEISEEFDSLPDYNKIIKISDDALAEIGKTSGPVQFDWLPEEKHASSSGECSKHSK